MNKIILPLACVIVLASCNNTAKTEDTKNEQKAPKIALQLSDLATPKDVVCGMDLSPESIEDTTSYEGKVYGFCATGCKEEFLKNPASYLTQK